MRDPGARDQAVRRFRAHLEHDHGCRATTINNYLAALDHFYREHQGLGAAAVPRQRRAGRPAVPDPTEMRRFQSVVVRLPSPRDRAVCALVRHGGLRVRELAAVEVGDLVRGPAGMQVAVRAPGGGVLRISPVLPEDARGAVEHWLRLRLSRARSAGTRSAVAEQAECRRLLLVGRQGGGLSERRIRQILARVGAEAAVPVTAHRLRRALASRLRGDGHGPAQVQEWLGGHLSASPPRAAAAASSERRGPRGSSDALDVGARFEVNQAAAARLDARRQQLLGHAVGQIRKGHLGLARARDLTAGAYEFLAAGDPVRYAAKAQRSRAAATAARVHSHGRRDRLFSLVRPRRSSPCGGTGEGRADDRP
ncbi:tyrosine-type recombinase/integrase [Spirillospora sp. NPDC050679]